MTPREQRQKVLVKARMLSGGRWQDVCILNFSAHGLGLACDDAPTRGAYLEIRRGGYIFVARVCWARGHRFGARTQDPVAAIAVTGPETAGLRMQNCGTPVERRAGVRKVALSKSGRDRGRAMEFAGIAMALAAGAAVLAENAYATLAEPMTAVEAALSAR